MFTSVYRRKLIHKIVIIVINCYDIHKIEHNFRSEKLEKTFKHILMLGEKDQKIKISFTRHRSIEVSLL